ARETCYHRGFAVRVEDEIGAGDAFNAGFLAAMFKGFSVEQSLCYANAVGAISVTVKGDQEALPTWKDLDLFVENYEDCEGQLLR
ncbi:MAG: carbohydrate kinase family protein, partial [Firmicutes bacterium]|nr:carbohydrate kinase family protein [Bacillota bacterium]